MQTYTSAYWMFKHTGTRASAIEACIKFLTETGINGLDSGRFTWRAEDGSGFTIAVTVNITGVYAELSHKWNKSRNS